MGIERCKRARECNTTFEEREDEQQQQGHKAATESVLFCRILELPMHLVYDILSRLPPKTIFYCRCVCKTFLKILTDPYFAKIHLVKAPNVAASFILRDISNPSAFHFVYMLDLEEASSAASRTTYHHPYHRRRLSRSRPALSLRNTKFQFSYDQVTLVGSCNGLLCLRHRTWPRPTLYVCNPVLGELMVLLPSLTSLAPGYSYLPISGFGFCPKTQQYKVINFISMSHIDPVTDIVSSKTVAEIYTLGTESWRRIGDAPSLPKSQASFDSFLNGSLHWISFGIKASISICSFNFEAEQFQSVPPPTHFDPDFVNKVTWINIGVLGKCLCLCYVLGDAQFDVWVMKEYGVKESWTRQFVIDINYYCGLRAEHLNQPIKFSNNGDLLFLCYSRTLVCYCHGKKTFREFKAFGPHEVEAIVHTPSFISLKDIARGDLVKNVKWKRRDGMNIYVGSS